MAARHLSAIRRTMDALRLRLSRAEALPQLSILGVLCGLVSGTVIIVFRMLVEAVQAAFLPGGNPENYEALDEVTRLALPVAGALVIGLIFQFASERARSVGVVHVMERLAYHQGRLPLPNAVLQLIGAALSILAGHSVGREGPAIHLGAASGSLAGQSLGLPNNSLRVLTGCGVAAAIAAAFNTPLAGVVFAMEVMILEYTVVGFAPVILAAVSATALTRLAYGPDPSFTVPPIGLGSLLELPYVLFMGVAVGALASVFVIAVGFFGRQFRNLPLWVRMVIGGAIVGLCAIPAPQVMGIGYDTLDAALVGSLGLGVLATVLVFKLIATAGGIGMGLPGGLIGPMLVLGALAGGMLGEIGQWWAPVNPSTPGFYALMGMAAMMSGALHAPLAALTAILELTGNPRAIMPGMLAVIASLITCRSVFRQESVYRVLLRARGLDYRHDPMAEMLGRVGVGAAMDRRVERLAQRASRDEVRTALEQSPRWILVERENRCIAMLPAADLALALQQAEADELDLLSIPAGRLQVTGIDLRETLREALQLLDASGAEALYVSSPTDSGREQIYGVLTRARIEESYRTG